MFELTLLDLYHPSIEYLELYALVAGILTWEFKLRNMRLFVKCDNQAVIAMVNSMSSTCPQCMYLIRVLVLNNLKFNRHIFATFVSSKQNHLSDALSRGKIQKFLQMSQKEVNRYPDKLNPQIWPASKLWRQF